MDLYRFIFCVLLVRYNTIRAYSPAALIYSNALFAKELYPIISRTEGNVLYSPISAHTVLSLLYQGATGNTAKSFENALHLPNAKQTATDYQSLLKLLNSVRNVTLNIANKMFVQKQSKVKVEFDSVARNQFLSEAENVNFVENVATAKHINDWVESETKKKITDLIKPTDLGGLTKLVLVNAIYFIGNWMKQFNPNDTKIEKFYVSENDTVHCDMMHLHADLSYSFNNYLDAQVIRLPYTDNDLDLTIILPKSKTGMKELEKKLLSTNLKFRPKNYTTQVTLSLPRFKIKAEMDLKESLTELGLGVIFTESAQFPNLVESEPLSVSKAIQKTFIEVNELGTEAPAATAVERSTMSAYVLPTAVFTANRPFIFMLTYKQGEELLPLFVGKLVKP